jgi:hypothetical protein
MGKKWGSPEEKEKVEERYWVRNALQWALQ